MKICQAVLKLWNGHKKNVNTQRAITPKVGYPELCSACRLMVFNVGVKFHENTWLVGCSGFNGPLRQYFSLYRAVSQREGERKEK